jgi:predicted phosphate transport protein (TIGR00153 family)
LTTAFGVGTLDCSQISGERVESVFRFIPRDEKFFDLFETAALNIREGAAALKEMAESEGDYETWWKRIEEYEHTGDRLTHDLIKRLNQTFITPLDREDIHQLGSGLDDVMDLIEAGATRLTLYKIERCTAEAKHLAVLIHQMAEEIVLAVQKLKDLNSILSHCVEINRLENLADQVSRDAIAALFVGGYDPIDIIKWKEIYETLETATDRCEDVADILERIVLKNA